MWSVGRPFLFRFAIDVLQVTTYSYTSCSYGSMHELHVNSPEWREIINKFLFGIGKANATIFQLTWKNCEKYIWHFASRIHICALISFCKLSKCPARTSWFVCNFIGITSTNITYGLAEKFEHLTRIYIWMYPNKCVRNFIQWKWGSNQT